MFVAENNGVFRIRIPDDVPDLQIMLNGKTIEAVKEGKLISVLMKKADKLEMTGVK